jgi:hypothetical protein
VNPRYSYAADASVVDAFSDCTRREREHLLRTFALLAESPNQRGEWFRRTCSGRELQIKRFGKWLVTYWADHPVLEVRIVDVERIVA